MRPGPPLLDPYKRINPTQNGRNTSYTIIGLIVIVFICGYCAILPIGFSPFSDLFASGGSSSQDALKLTETQSNEAESNDDEESGDIRGIITRTAPSSGAAVSSLLSDWLMLQGSPCIEEGSYSANQHCSRKYTRMLITSLLTGGGGFTTEGANR